MDKTCFMLKLCYKCIITVPINKSLNRQLTELVAKPGCQYYISILH